jgi:hypothetical protein
MVISLGRESDSTMVVVNQDPAVPISREMYDAKMKLSKRLEISINKLTAITDQLTEGDETIKKVESALLGVENKQADSIRRFGKAMTDSIKNIRDFILGKKQEKQGTGTPYEITANGKMNEARFSISGKNKIPDAQEVRIVEQGEYLVQQAINRSNHFFTGRWKDYQALVEGTPVKLFKEYKVME